MIKALQPRSWFAAMHESGAGIRGLGVMLANSCTVVALHDSRTQKGRAGPPTPRLRNQILVMPPPGSATHFFIPGRAAQGAGNRRHRAPACGKVGKGQIFMPVRDSSGESRLTRFDLLHMQRLPLVPISVPPPGPAQAVAKRISIPRCRGSNPAAPASQSGLYRPPG